MAEIAGLKLIVPSSVAGSGVSVSASGKVSFTAATSVSVNGVFSATYDNYLVVTQYGSSASVNIRMRMRASGTDDSTLNAYTTQYLAASSTTVSGARLTTTRFQPFLNGYNTQRSGAHVYYYGPFLAQPTAIRTVTVQDLSSAYIEDVSGTHNQSTAYDGFTMFPTTDNISGSLTIYGLSQ